MSALLQHLDLDIFWEQWTPPASIVDKHRLIGAPQHGIGRPCKVGKETIVGLLVALRKFAAETDESRTRRFQPLVHACTRRCRESITHASRSPAEPSRNWSCISPATFHAPPWIYASNWSAATRVFTSIPLKRAPESWFSTPGAFGKATPKDSRSRKAAFALLKHSTPQRVRILRSMGPPVAIVGGGISGLSCAYYLAKGGINSVIIESRPRLGGVICTEQVEGCVIEAGPDSFLSVKPAAMDLIRELGLADEVIGSNDHLRKTYVWKRGRLVPLPDGLMMMVPTRIMPMVTTSLVSWPTKIRMGLELFRSPRNGASDQSVAEFVASHYGQEAVDYLAEPLLSGIYGGSPRELSVRSVLPRFVELAEKYGSLTKGVLAERRRAGTQANPMPLFRTLKGGLGQLVDAVTRRSPARSTYSTAAPGPWSARPRDFASASTATGWRRIASCSPAKRTARPSLCPTLAPPSFSPLSATARR